MKYIPRNIDKYLLEWKDDPFRKTLLLRGARQVGKSTAVRELAKNFKYFIEVNLEKRPDIQNLFENLHDVKEIANRISAIYDVAVEAGSTLLFIDEIQFSKGAIKMLRYFKEDFPELHVVAAGSLLEFVLADLPSFGVGRITSFFMYPFSFEEFLIANGKKAWVKEIGKATCTHPVFEELHNEIIELWRTFILVGGMPEAVAAWVATKNYLKCFEVLQDIRQSYFDDFEKYSSKISPEILRNTLRSVVEQNGKKFVYSRIGEGYRGDVVKEALDALCRAGLIKEISMTSANGLPLGAEVKSKYTKYLVMDTGLMLRIQGMDTDNDSEAADFIFNSTTIDLVNKGSIAEMFAGLEFVKHSNPRIPIDLFYWENTAKGASAEVDFITTYKNSVMPIEIKSGTSGKMKSLRLFITSRNLPGGIRSSLENFTTLDISDGGINRTIHIIPLYALYNFRNILDAYPPSGSAALPIHPPCSGAAVSE